MTLKESLSTNCSFKLCNSNSVRQRRIALLLPSLAAGSIASVMLNLAAAFRQSGYLVDLLPCRIDESYVHNVPRFIRLIKLHPENNLSARLRLACLERHSLDCLARPALLALKPAFTQRYLADLVRYLRTAKPDILLSANTPANLLAIWGRRLAGQSTRVIASEHTHLGFQSQRIRKWKWRYILPMVAHVYPGADAIVSVSNGVADELANIDNLPTDHITTIYNPVVTRQLQAETNHSELHPWLADDGPPVIVAAGRFKPVKNFPLLIKAFVQLRLQRKARLLLFGEGKQRTELERLAREMKVESDIAMPGFIENPFAAFSRASVFALSSDYEGLGNVLIEALACGCPAVATDCPSGPREILADGHYGSLVPVGDVSALADAIIATLDRPVGAQKLKKRADKFSINASVDRYERLIQSLLQPASINNKESSLLGRSDV